MVCTAKPDALCSDTHGKYPNCGGSHIALNIRSANRTEVTRDAWNMGRREPAGRTTKVGEAAQGLR